ncbi:unnamed protein product, partial [Amoebophrya sp. A120]
SSFTSAGAGTNSVSADLFGVRPASSNGNANAPPPARASATAELQSEIRRMSARKYSKPCLQQLLDEEKIKSLQKQVLEVEELEREKELKDQEAAKMSGNKKNNRTYNAGQGDNDLIDIYTAFFHFQVPNDFKKPIPEKVIKVHFYVNKVDEQQVEDDARIISAPQQDRVSAGTVSSEGTSAPAAETAEKSPVSDSTITFSFEQDQTVLKAVRPSSARFVKNRIQLALQERDQIVERAFTAVGGKRRMINAKAFPAFGVKKDAVLTTKFEESRTREALTLKQQNGERGKLLSAAVDGTLAASSGTGRAVAGAAPTLLTSAGEDEDNSHCSAKQG